MVFHRKYSTNVSRYVYFFSSLLRAYYVNSLFYTYWHFRRYSRLKYIKLYCWQWPIVQNNGGFISFRGLRDRWIWIRQCRRLLAGKGKIVQRSSSTRSTTFSLWHARLVQLRKLIHFFSPAISVCQVLILRNETRIQFEY